MSIAPIVLVPRGPFSLAASSRFLSGFRPARYRGQDDGVLRLAFPVETPGGEWPTVGLAVHQRPDGSVLADPTTALPADVRERTGTQLARILSLDVDGAGFPAVGAADPVVGALQRQFAGLRPVCFYSPYEAAIWAVLSHRIRIAQAAAIKSRLAAVLGVRRTVTGVEVAAFPGPAALLALDEFPGLPEVKLQRLRSLAVAAADGQLDGARLRATEPADALAELQHLPGIGPFSAELILIRGAGTPDLFPRSERLLHAAMVDLYGLPGSEPPRLAEVARGWAPYRSWASLLIRASRESGDWLAEDGRRPADQRRTIVGRRRPGGPPVIGCLPVGRRTGAESPNPFHIGARGT